MTGPYRMTGPLPDAVPEPGFDPNGAPPDPVEPGPELDPDEEQEEGEPEEEAG